MFKQEGGIWDKEDLESCNLCRAVCVFSVRKSLSSTFIQALFPLEGLHRERKGGDDDGGDIFFLEIFT
jgi:hypothetical protein